MCVLLGTQLEFDPRGEGTAVARLSASQQAWMHPGMIPCGCIQLDECCIGSI